MITIDGSRGEGGGQIVRTALGLSTLTGRAFKVEKIRAGRREPGLKAQHVHCIKALEKLTEAKAIGASVGSRELEFYPGKWKGGTANIDVGTAGSITLLLQSIIVPCVFGNAKTKIKVKGGTDVAWSMPWDYFSEVLVPQLRRYAEIELKLIRRGHYPKGGGEVEIKITPMEGNNRKPLILLEPGNLMKINGISHATKDLEKAKVTERQANGAKQALMRMHCPLSIRTEYCESLSTGSGITLWAVYSKTKDEINFKEPMITGSDRLGEKGKRSEEIGIEAGRELLEEINMKSAVDKHLADNLIPIMAITGGEIKTSKITEHTKTNIETVKIFIEKEFFIDENKKIIRVL